MCLSIGHHHLQKVSLFPETWRQFICSAFFPPPFYLFIYLFLTCVSNQQLTIGQSTVFIYSGNRISIPCIFSASTFWASDLPGKVTILIHLDSQAHRTCTGYNDGCLMSCWIKLCVGSLFLQNKLVLFSFVSVLSCHILVRCIIPVVAGILWKSRSAKVSGIQVFNLCWLLFSLTEAEPVAYPLRHTLLSP